MHRFLYGFGLWGKFTYEILGPALLDNERKIKEKKYPNLLKSLTYQNQPYLLLSRFVYVSRLGYQKSHKRIEPRFEKKILNV